MIHLNFGNLSQAMNAARFPRPHAGSVRLYLMHLHIAARYGECNEQRFLARNIFAISMQLAGLSPDKSFSSCRLPLVYTGKRVAIRHLFREVDVPNDSTGHKKPRIPINPGTGLY